MPVHLPEHRNGIIAAMLSLLWQNTFELEYQGWLLVTILCRASTTDIHLSTEIEVGQGYRGIKLSDIYCSYAGDLADKVRYVGGRSDIWQNI